MFCTLGTGLTTSTQPPLISRRSSILMRKHAFVVSIPATLATPRDGAHVFRTHRSCISYRRCSVLCQFKQYPCCHYQSPKSSSRLIMAVHVSTGNTCRYVLHMSGSTDFPPYGARPYRGVSSARVSAIDNSLKLSSFFLRVIGIITVCELMVNLRASMVKFHSVLYFGR